MSWQTMLIYVVFFLTSLKCDLIKAIQVPCGETYQTQDGNHCRPCSRGYSKLSDCLNNKEQDRCAKCPDGEYQPNCDDSYKCIKCRLHCRPGEIQVQNCSAVSDIKCQCEDGKFEAPEAGKPNETTCTPHRDCRPGEGLEKKGTPYQNTICRQCEEGRTYSDEKSLDGCKPCSDCNTTFTTQNCTLTSDTVCDNQAVFKDLTTETHRKSNKEAITLGCLLAAVVIFVVGGPFIYICRKRRRTTRTDTEANNLATSSNNNSPNQNGLDPPSVNGIVNINGKRDGHSDPLLSMQNGSLSCRSEQSDSQQEDIPLQSKHKEEANNEKNVEKENGIYEMSSVGYNESNDISTDAQGVPPRSSSQSFMDQSILNRSQRSEGLASMSESGDERVLFSTKTGVTMPSERSDGNERRAVRDNPQSNADTDNEWQAVRRNPQSNPDSDNAMNAEGGNPSSNRDSDNREKAVRGNPPSNPDIDNQEKVWMSVISFLSKNMDVHQFKDFYRWLAVNTNKDLAQTKDADINHAFSENLNNSKESIYQLITKWRQAIPNASIDQVKEALKKANLVQIHDKLVDFLQENRLASDRPLSSSSRMDEPLSSSSRMDEPLSSSSRMDEPLSSSSRMDEPQMKELKEPLSTQ